MHPCFHRKGIQATLFLLHRILLYQFLLHCFCYIFSATSYFATFFLLHRILLHRFLATSFLLHRILLHFSATSYSATSFLLQRFYCKHLHAIIMTATVNPIPRARLACNGRTSLVNRQILSQPTDKDFRLSMMSNSDCKAPMKSVLGHDSALVRLSWAGDNQR